MIAPVLVLGASGFIGRWVARELTKRGKPLVVAARDPSATGDVLHRWGAKGAIVTADLAREGAGRALVAKVRPAVVFNLAGYGVDRGERDDAMAERLNAHLVRDLAVACAPTTEWAGALLVHVGSALEYGTAAGVLHEDGPATPTTTYGRTKLAGTLAVREVASERGTRGLTARLFTVFGDGEHEGRLFPSLLAAARRGTPIDLTDGRQPRDLAWVEDVARALVDVASAPFIPGEIVNFATGRLHAVQAFTRAVAAEAGLSVELLRFGALPTRPEEMWPAGVAVERITALLGAPLPGDLGAIVASAVRDARRRETLNR